ncbi:S-layer-like y domain-containing protein [Cohnella lubricantis]|uniref:S-layer homology domain-containing protein n=1 Tax=Cohnella lubricantis TaxID=2163172 RepID=A0A841TGQ4_9BACL|nr:S-layer homology domain-containing protein [Cohnella lubricantis]MBB6677631.1 S-layer homology domain-containing protein [Cohnella lubricantis]MBP2116481.1 hypothetical protein [Cohnella lubricantis]
MLKRWTSLFVVLILAIVTFASVRAEAVQAKDLSDIAKHWAKSAIEQAVAKGYVTGYPDETFKPNNTVSRAEFIKMLVDSLGYPHQDVPGGKWWRGYVDAAVSMNIHDETDFKDGYDQPITRLEVMRLTARALAGANPSYNDGLTAFDGLYNGDIPYTDFRSLTQKDVPLVALTMGSGIVEGYEDLSAGFDMTATRAEAVTMIERMLAMKEKDADDTFALRELKDVAETGTNADLFGWDVLTTINDGHVKVSYPSRTLVMKRLYVLPIKGGQHSLFEQKFIDKDMLNYLYSYEYLSDGDQGIIVGVAGLTSSIDLKYARDWSANSYFNPEIRPFYSNMADKFGYSTAESLPLNESIKKNVKTEVSMWSSYNDNTKTISFQNNYVNEGDVYPLILQKGVTKSE